MDSSHSGASTRAMGREVQTTPTATNIRRACLRGRSQQAWPCCGTPQPPKGGIHLVCPLAGLTQARQFLRHPSPTTLSRRQAPAPPSRRPPPGGSHPKARARPAPRSRLRLVQAFCVARLASHLLGTGSGVCCLRRSGASLRFSPPPSASVHNQAAAAWLATRPAPGASVSPSGLCWCLREASQRGEKKS